MNEVTRGEMLERIERTRMYSAILQAWSPTKRERVVDQAIRSHLSTPERGEMGWRPYLRELIKNMKLAIVEGKGFYPSDGDIDNLKKIDRQLQSPDGQGVPTDKDAQSESPDPNEIPMANPDKDYTVETRMCPKCGEYWMRMIPEKRGPLWVCSCGHEERWSQDAPGEGEDLDKLALEMAQNLSERGYVHGWSFDYIKRKIGPLLQKQGGETARPSVTREWVEKWADLIDTDPHKFTKESLLSMLAELGVEMRPESD